jgi:hypothetical protein
MLLLQSVGRRSLAIKLLEEEPSAAQQVPLLISLAKGTSTTSGSPQGADASPGGEGAEDTLSRALRKAVDARDPDLVYLALFAAYRSKPLPEFWKMVGPRPTARNLFVKYTRIKVRYLALLQAHHKQPGSSPRCRSGQVAGLQVGTTKHYAQMYVWALLNNT